MKRLLKISSMTGSALVPTARLSGDGAVRSSTRCPRSLTVAAQPGSMTVVEFDSAMIAGPGTTSPAAMADRS